MESIYLKTKDNINIGVNYYKNNFDEVLIIAPGWCMTKDSDAFVKISEKFSKHFDILAFDFRGHGKSSGFYTFSAKEIKDLDAVVQFAQSQNYKKIYLAGFSLGAAVALIYASQNDNIDKVIAVSAPYEFEKIENHMWKKSAWGETFKKFELSRFLSIRPYPIPLKKIKPSKVIKNLKVPTLFIAGEKDPTVHSWHTEKLYTEAVCAKDYKLYKNGYHAEDLFLHFEEDFTQQCLKWLKDN